ncbi:Uncharacterised protein [Vibrio cholerae]|nr:Uncharacterised protein [Vibrio cholerae]
MYLAFSDDSTDRRTNHRTLEIDFRLFITRFCQ